MFHMSMLRALKIQVERYKLCFFQNILLSTPQNPIRNACILEVALGVDEALLCNFPVREG